MKIVWKPIHHVHEMTAAKPTKPILYYYTLSGDIYYLFKIEEPFFVQFHLAVLSFNFSFFF